MELSPSGKPSPRAKWSFPQSGNRHQRQNGTFPNRETPAKSKTKLSPVGKPPPRAKWSFPQPGNPRQEQNGTFPNRETPAKSKTELSPVGKPPSKAKWSFPQSGNLARTPIHRINMIMRNETLICEINRENPKIGGNGVWTKRQ
jgi:hypothetical protein